MSHFGSGFEEIREEEKIRYKREFLLYLSEFDSCKKLPNEFDSSISLEPSDPYAGLLQPPCDSETNYLERKLQEAMRQNPENGLPSKVSFTREAVGKVGASPSEVQNRTQNTENGLLGKGSFPRRPECIVGFSSEEVQSCGFHLLSRSSTPYLPPHLSKENLLSQVETRGINDVKTFGSTVFSTMEKVFEERRIRDSFELMKKAEKAFQEERDQREDLDLEDTSGQDLDEKSEGLDEICLPDEDSLITVEDFIVPKRLLLMPDRAWSLAEIGSFFPATPEENFRKLPVHNSSSDNKSKPNRENTYVDWNAGLLNPHLYQPHANPSSNLFHSQSLTAAGPSEVQSLSTKFSHDLAFSTTPQSGAWQNFNDPFANPSQLQIQPPGGFPITHRTAPIKTKNSPDSTNQISGDFETLYLASDYNPSGLFQKA